MDSLYLILLALFLLVIIPRIMQRRRLAAIIGLVGRKIILASLRYFFSPSLALFIGKEQPGQ